MTIRWAIGGDKCYFLILDGVATHKYKDLKACKNHLEQVVANEEGIVILDPILSPISPPDYGWNP